MKPEQSYLVNYHLKMKAVKPVSDKIPIVQLAPGQKIKIECYARLGRGTEHAKWNSSNIATLTDTEQR